jgi:hypothetical protein
MITYHHAKNELDRRILDDDIDVAGSGPAIAIFRLLLSHAFYSGDSYGWVRDDRSSVDTIAKLTGYSIRTVKEHLQTLTNAGLIRRYKRPKLTGGRWPDRIFIRWDYLHAESGDGHDSEGAAPALMESPAPSEGAAPANLGAAPALSYSSKEEPRITTKNAGKPAPKSGGSTPSGENPDTTPPGPTLRDEGVELLKEYAALTGQAPGDIENEFRAAGLKVREVIVTLQARIAKARASASHAA